jgi:hypothetical protein
LIHRPLEVVFKVTIGSHIFYVVSGHLRDKVGIDTCRTDSTTVNYRVAVCPREETIQRTALPGA